MDEWKGVKFKTVFLKKEVQTDLRIEDLKYWISRFGFYDLCQPFAGRSYGNMSFRLKPGSDEFIITSTQQGFREDITDDKFVKVVECDMENIIVKVEGLELPSSETFAHYVVYKNRPDINAVFHGHCTKIVCSTDIGFCTTEKRQPYGTVELANEVLKVLDKENFIIIKDHGFLALGKDIDDAGKVTLRAYQKCFQ
ncbi:MAG: class II aldolase/adducin family protein [Candidatus Micrarchaeota archaeon]|nr:class II aldolase/adducin family protein [Candidatus Micrarchaeota archaeon]